MSETYGLGALQSPPDPRDWPLQLAPLTAPLPPRFVTTGMGPVNNQGDRPWCQAFAASGLAQWDAKADHHGVVDMDEALFYSRLKTGYAGVPGDGIAGDGSNGRAACRMLAKVGYPETGHPENVGRNKIAAYYAVPLDLTSLKTALVQYGPLLVGSFWYASWFRPTAGILPPAAGGVVGGHATLLFGWDDAAAGGSLLIRNSWGLYPGSVNGNCYMPFARFVPAIFEVWKTVDAAD